MGHSTGAPALGPFLEQLEERLDRFTHAELQDALRTHARSLRPEERRAFLAILSPPKAAAPSAPSAPDTAEESDVALLDEIGDFIERLEAGEYCHGWGWDSEIGDERAFGDESWADEMDDLFDAAADAFLVGQHALAAAAYGRLLEAFLLDDGPVFCGPAPPEEMVRTDVDEAKARYLRALYETTAPAERAAELLEAVLRLGYVGSPMDLAALSAADTTPLTDLVSFLPGWLERLQGWRGDPYSRGDQVARLLREAIEISQGADGLAELARTRGEYLAWVEALVRAERRDEAIAAGREGLERLPPARTRALLAERVAELAVEDGDALLVLAARRSAWQAEPMTERLVALWRAARDTHGHPDGVLAEETAAAHASDSLRERPALACRLWLLAGDYAPALDRFVAAPALGWSHPGHPGPVVLPFLLLIAAGQTTLPPDSALADLWGELDRSGSGFSSGYGDILLQTLSEHPVVAAQATLHLNLAKEAIWQRMNAIVANQHRGAYERAALLVVAGAETLALRGDGPGATRFLARAADAFPRHRSFRGALDQHQRRSVLLRDL
jgi:tetratricopeptide (TPR) repeat protein